MKQTLVFAPGADTACSTRNCCISRSGNGAHAWIFFDRNVSAFDARRLGASIISHASARDHG
ncbi:hypothetical protein F2A38_28215 [Pseudomonas chlororaphis]|uniref:TOTE conflict system primase domain-containing protein n=1 Tax=Pseudomonas chlororaphis TaxID=587753 RepID=A0AB34BWZ4_9PSED|nr:hypothetical protein F2A38_28215 [Pseudomonas chlororaphis]